ncbi:hypothetical protein [Hyphomonas sp.]|uniref:hypothetical protein n=1 Tax=Hyphomonas sp. TaxID=87 RepID=UPI0039193AF8
MDMQAALDLLRTYPEVVIAILSAIVALISAFVARGETAKQRRLQTERLRQGIDVASLDWGAGAIDALARAAAFARTKHMHTNDMAFEAARAGLLINLSTLVDRGRMFFPNIAADQSAADKESAYQGTRPPILDALMFPYHELTCLAREGGPTGEESGAFIDECRRLLVSELQAHLDPRRLDQIVGRYDQRALHMRKEALGRAKALRGQLQARRPDVALDRPALSQTSPEQTV